MLGESDNIGLGRAVSLYGPIVVLTSGSET